MKETQRIIKQFEYLYNGESWIGVNIVDTLTNITAEQAANKIAVDRN